MSRPRPLGFTRGGVEKVKSPLRHARNGSLVQAGPHHGRHRCGPRARSRRRSECTVHPPERVGHRGCDRNRPAVHAVELTPPGAGFDQNVLARLGGVRTVRPISRGRHVDDARVELLARTARRTDPAGPSHQAGSSRRAHRTRGSAARSSPVPQRISVRGRVVSLGRCRKTGGPPRLSPAPGRHTPRPPRTPALAARGQS